VVHKVVSTYVELPFTDCSIPSVTDTMISRGIYGSLSTTNFENSTSTQISAPWSPGQKAPGHTQTS